MERPPGMLALGGGPDIFMEPDGRPSWLPTGCEDGREPWGALRQA